MRDSGTALMGIGQAAGDRRAGEAARQAISSPLLESSVKGATGILLNITGGSDLGLFEVNDAAEVIADAADANANIIFGAVIDESLGDHIRVTVVATGFDRTPQPLPRRALESDDRPRTGRLETREFDIAAPRSLEVGDDALDVPSFLKSDD
jgi:cell division protein FtsZ